MRAASHVHTQKESEDFQFLLSLFSLESSSGKHDTADVAIFEAFHYSLAPADTVEKILIRAFEDHYPEMLQCQIWGYADIVPFRDLSLDEEWQGALTDVLWADLSVTKDSLHQYLFGTPGAKPKVALPSTAAKEGNLTIYRLPPPVWAERD